MLSLVLLPAALLFSCQKEEMAIGEVEHIKFQVNNIPADGWLETKAAQKESFVSGDLVEVYAWKSTGDVFGEATKDFDTVLTFDGSVWTPGEQHSYPAGEKLFVRAVYPQPSSSTNGITVSSDKRTITYTTPAEVSNQPDMLAAGVDSQTSGTVDLNFSHALASVKFVVGSTMKANFRLTQIVLYRIWTSGTFDYSSWSGTATSNITYGDGTNAFYTHGSQAAGTNMLPNDYCFMLVPQDLPSESTAEIQIKYLKPDGTSGQFSLSLKSVNFEMGKSYTYSINYKEEGGFAKVTVSNFSGVAW